MRYCLLMAVAVGFSGLAACLSISAALPAAYRETEAARPAKADITPYLQTRHDSPADLVYHGDQAFSQTTPIGNGYMGAMIYGGTREEVILINEKTLWSGGPGENPDYPANNYRNSPLTAQTRLQSIRERLQAAVTAYSSSGMAFNGNNVTSDYPEELQSQNPGGGHNNNRGPLVRDIETYLFGDRNGFGSYQELGKIHLFDPAGRAPEAPPAADIPSENTVPANYVRGLNLETGVVQTAYTKDGVHYKKEYFMNYPDNVFVMKMSADKPFDQTIGITTPQPRGTVTVVDGHTLQLTGQPAGQRGNGLHFYQQARVIPVGTNAAVVPEGGYLAVKNAAEIIIIMAAGTNYRLAPGGYFKNSGIAFRETRTRLNGAVAIGYNALLRRHIEDHQALFGRVDFRLAGAPAAAPAKTTRRLVRGYGADLPDDFTRNTTEEDRYLEILYFQFGRYLLIASSRAGSLPANLQGVWAAGLNPPWQADYHTNINVQMNYWPAQSANLAETHIPMIEYVRAQVPEGTKTARHYHARPVERGGKPGSGSRGWVAYHVNNIWGHTLPENYFEAAYAPSGAAWMALDIWEYYQFTRDEQFLREHYNTLVGAALFWVDNLWIDTRDGALVANPSFSPEHGPYSLGAASDQGIIGEIFEAAIKANKALTDSGGRLNHAEEMQEIIAARARLSGPRIGRSGYFQEWKDESLMDRQGTNTPGRSSGSHRHVNHLFMLHPGTMVVPGRSAGEDALAGAMKVTLNTRGDGGTGWSKAWKVNFWARLRDGERAHKLYSELLQRSTFDNLFDTHPPFQIDGNFGGTAGVAEMLLQSHGGAIELLPALPGDTWAAGYVKGLMARGNIEVDMRWNGGILSSAVLKPGVSGEVRIKYPGLSNAILTDKNGVKVSFSIENDDEVRFDAAAGEVYTFGK